MGRDQCEVVRNRAGFLKKNFSGPKMAKMGPKWPKNRVFQGFLKILSLVFPGNGLKYNLSSLATSLWKFHACENSSSWDNGKKALGQSECRILKLAISQERMDELAWFFDMLAQTYERKHLIILLTLSVVRFGCGHMLSANQIAGFLNWLYLKKELKNWPYFVYAYSDLWKEAFDNIT